MGVAQDANRFAATEPRSIWIFLVLLEWWENGGLAVENDLRPALRRVLDRRFGRFTLLPIVRPIWHPATFEPRDVGSAFYSSMGVMSVKK